MRSLCLQCCSPQALLITVVLVESTILTAWITREYFFFDYSCFTTQLFSNNSRIPANQTLREITVYDVKEAEDILPKHRAKRNINDNYNYNRMNAEVHVESLKTLKSDESSPVEIKTKTLRFHRNQKRRRKKKQSVGKNNGKQKEGISDKVEVEVPDKKENKRENENVNTDMSEKNNFNKTKSQKDNVKREGSEKKRKKKIRQKESYVIDVYCEQCESNDTRVIEVTVTPQQGHLLNFTVQLEHFAQNMLCFGRVLLDGWAVSQVLSALPVFIGIYYNVLCLFTPYLVFKVLFLVVSFVYGATLTIFALVLFCLIVEMTWKTLLEWFSFALAMDALFVLASLGFLLVLQSCEELFLAKTRKAARNLEVEDTNQTPFYSQLTNDEVGDNEQEEI